MRGRVLLTAVAIAATVLAGRCIVAPREGRPSSGVQVGVRPGLPALQTTPTPWLRSPTPAPAPAETATPAPAPTPTP